MLPGVLEDYRGQMSTRQRLERPSLEQYVERGAETQQGAK